MPTILDHSTRKQLSKKHALPAPHGHERAGALAQPLPMNGMAVAMIVMNWTLVDRGMLAIWTTAAMASVMSIAAWPMLI